MRPTFGLSTPILLRERETGFVSEMGIEGRWEVSWLGGGYGDCLGGGRIFA